MEANNTKAMCEAVAKCVNLITEFGNAEIVKTPLDVIVDIEAILKAAIAKPSRNCDVGTAQEQEVRFERFCHAHRSRERCCEDCPIVADMASCEFTWAQLPYEGECDASK